MVLFCGIAGNTPSVLRAAVMISMLQLAPRFRRERDGATDVYKRQDVDQDWSNAPLGAVVEYARLKIEEEEEEIPGGGDEGDDEPFQPAVTYEFTVTDEERAAIHEAVDNLAGYVGDRCV